MERFVAQLRHDMRQRAQAQDYAFEWPLGSADEDHTVLPYRFHHNVSAMVREAASNALKHGSGGIRVTAEIEAGGLRIGISNAVIAAGTDGAGGLGLRNIASRAAELGGSAEMELRDGRFLVSVALPLPRAEA
jgi:signal transduction histidine kinase